MPKTPNEIIEELKSRIDFEKQPIFCTGEAYQKPLEWLYDVLSEKDKQKEEAVAELERTMWDSINRHIVWVDDDDAGVSEFVVPVQALKTDLAKVMTKDPAFTPPDTK